MVVANTIIALGRRLLLPSSPFSVPFRLVSGDGLSYGLDWALAGKGVIIKDKVFHNLDPSNLQNEGAKTVECLSGFPMFVRGDVFSGASEISSALFSKLLKQVTSHISLETKVFVQDGAIGSHSKCDAKVRIISDSPTAVLTLSSFLWKVSSRAVSHDPCPLTVYVASSMRPSVGSIVGLPSSHEGFLAADIERSSLILCGKSFADATGVRDALVATAAPVICARSGLPLHARITTLGDSTILLFALGGTFQKCCNVKDIIVSDIGAMLFPGGASPFFSTGNHATITVQKPASIILTAADSLSAIPPISKLSAGQAAYHFLAGYHDGKFFPTYSRGPSPIPSLELARALQHYLEESEVQSFLININYGGKHVEGEYLYKLARKTLFEDASVCLLSAASDQRARDLKRMYKSFLVGKFGTLPRGFSF